MKYQVFRMAMQAMIVLTGVRLKLSYDTPWKNTSNQNNNTGKFNDEDIIINKLEMLD